MSLLYQSISVQRVPLKDYLHDCLAEKVLCPKMAEHVVRNGFWSPSTDIFEKERYLRCNKVLEKSKFSPSLIELQEKNVGKIRPLH